MSAPARVLKSVGPKLVPFFKTVAIYFVVLTPTQTPSLFAVCVKCAPILSLIIFVLLYGTGRGDEHKYSRRILAGLAFSCIGDALLVWPSQFLTGMASFGMAQVAYCSAYGFKPLKLPLGAFVYAVTGFVVSKLLPGANGLLRYGLPVYSMLLATQVWRALTRAHTWPGIGSAVGALLFAVSDGLIGVQVCIGPVKYGQLLIMSTYYLAQLFISLSIVDSNPLQVPVANATQNQPKDKAKELNFQRTSRGTKGCVKS